MTNKRIRIPRFNLDHEKKMYIPSLLIKIQNSSLVRSYEKQGYQLGLVGQKKSINKDLPFQNLGYCETPFIHFDEDYICQSKSSRKKMYHNFLIRYFNKLISNRKNDFNITPLGIHTLGMVPIKEIQNLIDNKFGLYQLFGLRVFAKKERQIFAKKRVNRNEGKKF